MSLVSTVHGLPALGLADSRVDPAVEQRQSREWLDNQPQ